MTANRLPNPENTIIEDAKLAGYCLNPNHVDGKHKARVFASALDLTLENSDELKQALLFAVKSDEAVPDKANAYGQKYIIDFSYTRGDKTATIHSVWMVDNNENIPRLVTCYIL